MEKHDRHFWKVDFDDLDDEIKGDLEMSDENVLCVCKQSLGVLEDEHKILIKKNAMNINY